MFKSTILIIVCFLLAGCVENISYQHHRRRQPIHPPVCQPHRRPMPRRVPVVIVKRVPNYDRHRY